MACLCYGQKIVCFQFKELFERLILVFVFLSVWPDTVFWQTDKSVFVCLFIFVLSVER